MAEQTSRSVLLRRAAAAAAATVALVAGAVVAAQPANADVSATHYVDCSATANGDGTIGAPWNSLAAVRAHGAFTAGDQILLKRGTTCKGQLAVTGSGTAAAPNVIGAYPSKGSKPTVAGGGTANNSGAVQIVNQSYWTVQDLHITNTTSSSTKTYRSGLLFQSDNGGMLAGLTAQRLTIDGVTSNPGNGNTRAYGGISALTFGSAVVSGFTGLRILGNHVSNVSRTGIIASNSQWPKGYDQAPRISGNTVSHVRGDGIVMIGAKTGRIDHNTVAYAGNLGSCSHCGRYGGPSTASAGIWPSNTLNALMDHNEVYGTYKGGGDGEGFDIDRGAVGTVMEFNYAHDNQGGGVLLCGAKNSTIRFNIFENNTLAALSFYGKSPSTSTAFYNNTVYASKGSKAKVVRTFGAVKGSKVSFKNNLVYSYGPGQYQWPTKSVSTAANTLLGLVSSTRPRDSRTSFSNPGLKSPGTGRTGMKTLGGYKPRHPSSFVRGVAIPKSATTDFFGKKVNPKHPPRGAAG